MMKTNDYEDKSPSSVWTSASVCGFFTPNRHCKDRDRDEPPRLAVKARQGLVIGRLFKQRSSRDGSILDIKHVSGWTDSLEPGHDPDRINRPDKSRSPGPCSSADASREG
jgi:hypothetical protein